MKVLEHKKTGKRFLADEVHEIKHYSSDGGSVLFNINDGRIFQDDTHKYKLVGIIQGGRFYELYELKSIL